MTDDAKRTLSDQAESLRDLARSIREDPGLWRPPPEALEKAADTIESLQAENEKLRQQLADCSSALGAAEEQGRWSA